MVSISNHLIKLLLILFVLTKACPVHAAINIEQGVPSGFELLEEPRATYVNVYYGGESIGSYPAHYTPTHFYFDQPDAIIARIPAATEKAKIAEQLRSPLPSHADLICRKGRTEDCGMLKPELAGVIFDETRLTAELFINGEYLGLQDSGGPRYLPLPERKFSSVYGFNGAVAGSNETTTNYALTSASTLSFGEGRLASQTTLTNNGLRFDTAAFSADRDGMEGMAGLFRSRGMQLIPDRDIAGVSLATSTRTRIDRYKFLGNDIILYLPRRALVSIYREGRLYSSRSYEAGNQSIDTSELPEGAYPIQLTIQEPDGTVREETRFLAKSPEIPPPDEPTYYAQGGVIRRPTASDDTIPQLTGRPLVRLGNIRRITDDSGLDISILGLRDQAALEMGYFLLYPGGQMRSTLMSTSKGAYGAQSSYLYTMEKWNVALDARRIWTDKRITSSDYDIDPLADSLTQFSSILNYTLTPDITLGLRGAYSKQGALPSNKTYGPSMEWYIWRRGESMLSLNADAGKTDEDYTANVFLRFSMRFGKYGASSSAGYAKIAGNNGPSSNMRGWYDDTSPDHALILGVSALADSQTKSISTDGDWRNAFGRARGFVQQSQPSGDGSSTLNYGGNFTFSAAQTDAALHIGGDNSDTSAVIVEVGGDSEIPMKILVGGMQRGTVNPGGEQALYLSPYQTYNIRLSETKSALLDYDSSTRHVTLYPGNVVRLRWEVNKFYVVSARIVSESGTPLGNAVLQESREQVVTSEKGRLQAQLSNPKRLTFITEDDNACEVELPVEVKPKNGVLIYKEVLICKKIS